MKLSPEPPLWPPAPPLFYTVRSAAEILTLKLDPHDCLFGDRLLTKGGRLLIAGPPSIGKSRLLLELAVAAILGEKWLGVPTHARGLPWLILQTENSNRRLQTDLKILVKQYGDGFVKNLFIHTMDTDMDAVVGLESNRDKIAQAIQMYQPEIVAIDPLRDFAIGDLNSDADMTATCAALGQVVRQGNAQRALIIVHHALTGRAGVIKAIGWDRAGFARNSKVLAGWVRGQINIAPGSPDDNDTLVIGCGKVADGKPFTPFAVQRNAETGIYEALPDFDFEAWEREISSRTKSGGVRSSYTIKEAFEKLTDFKGWAFGKLKEEIISKIGCSDTKAKELIKEGRQRGAWHKARRTGHYTKGASLD